MSKLVLVLIVLLVMVSGCFVIYKQSRDNESLTQDLATVRESNATLSRQIDLQASVSTITDTLVAGGARELVESNKNLREELVALDKIKAVKPLDTAPLDTTLNIKATQDVKHAGVKQTQAPTTVLDYRLHDDLIRLLDESCKRANSSTCNDPSTSLIGRSL